MHDRLRITKEMAAAAGAVLPQMRPGPTVEIADLLFGLSELDGVLSALRLSAAQLNERYQKGLAEGRPISTRDISQALIAHAETPLAHIKQRIETILNDWESDDDCADAPDPQ